MSSICGFYSMCYKGYYLEKENFKELPSMPMQIVTLNGSVRTGNYTALVLALAIDELRKQSSVEVTEIDFTLMELASPGRTSNQQQLRQL
jgi:hypothetical protein